MVQRITLGSCLPLPQEPHYYSQPRPSTLPKMVTRASSQPCGLSCPKSSSWPASFPSQHLSSHHEPRSLGSSTQTIFPFSPQGFACATTSRYTSSPPSTWVTLRLLSGTAQLSFPLESLPWPLATSILGPQQTKS